MTDSGFEVKRHAQKGGGWFRMYVQMVDDSKVQFLSDRLFKFWVNMLAVTSRERGYLPDIRDIAFKLRIPMQEAEENVTALLTSGLLDWVEHNGKRVLQPHNWFDWQPPQTVSTARVHRFRERKKARAKKAQARRGDGASDGGETGCNKSETRFETLETLSTSTSNSESVDRDSAYQERTPSTVEEDTRGAVSRVRRGGAR